MQPGRINADAASARWDLVGIVASAACLVHCLALPAIVMAAPFLGLGVLLSETFHRLFLLIVLPAGLFGLAPGVLRHRDGRVAALGLLGIALLSAGAIGGIEHWGPWAEKGLTLLGGSSMLVAHVRNRRL